VAVLLAIAGALAFIDRQMMGLLTEPVKQDMGLSDFQLSLLQGFAFVLFSSGMAVPLGYLTDRSSRRRLIAIGIFLWSIATAASGLSRSFGQLFAARLGVGIGESSLLPAGQSLLPDYYDNRALPWAFAIFQTGIYVGGGGAYAIGGAILSLATTVGPISLPLVGHLRPWQATFLIAALPGPFIAALMFTIREPARRTNPLVREASQGAGRFTHHLAKNSGFLLSTLGTAAALGVMAHGVVAWTPSFFIRTFGWRPAQVGMIYGAILILAGGSGTLLGGLLAQTWARRGRAAPTARVLFVASLACTPFAVAYPLCSTPPAALACLAAFSLCVGVTASTLPSVLQLATPHEFRGRMGGLYVIATTAVGAALGPVAIASITQFVLRDPNRLREAISIVCGVAGPLSAVLSFASFKILSRVTQSSAPAPAG
jgi:MFS family permease